MADTAKKNFLFIAVTDFSDKRVAIPCFFVPRKNFTDDWDFNRGKVYLERLYEEDVSSGEAVEADRVDFFLLAGDFFPARCSASNRSSLMFRFTRLP